MMKKYHWYDNLQYFFLFLMAAAMPIGWRYGLWAALALGTATLVKVVAQHRVGNPVLNTPLRWTLLMPVVYWLVLAVSLLWSSDLSAGLDILRLKAVLLIFPLCFLLSDSTYLTAGHFRVLGYALVAAVVGVFLYFAVKAGVSMTQGSSFKEVTGRMFDPRHHSYTSLYATVAMAFIYFELTRHWCDLRVWHRVLLIAAVPLMVCYVVLVNSRAGMLAMGMAALACVIHLALTRRSWKLGVGVALLLAGGLVAATQLLPGYVNRISSTVQNVEKDARTSINRCNWHLYTQSPVVGYGVGDYRDQQVKQYEADEYGTGVKAGYNAHNQYMESLLAAGVLGLLVLLLFLLMPLSEALRCRSRHRFAVALLIAVVMLNLLFESMLERQMGLLFIGYLYSLMVLILSQEENKFCR